MGRPRLHLHLVARKFHLLYYSIILDHPGLCILLFDAENSSGKEESLGPDIFLSSSEILGKWGSWGSSCSDESCREHFWQRSVQSNSLSLLSKKSLYKSPPGIRPLLPCTNPMWIENILLNNCHNIAAACCCMLSYQKSHSPPLWIATGLPISSRSICLRLSPQWS